MAKIYAAPKQIQQPGFNPDTWKQDEARYIEELRAHVKSIGDNSPESGKIIRFQVADGYAQYMVVSMKPLVLVHIPVGDAWQFQYAARLTAKDVREEVAHSDARERLFSKAGM